jgi:hypothetical protein
MECRHSKTCAVPGLRPVQGLRTGLVVDPTEAAVLAQAYQLVADGGSLVAASRLFIASGLPTRRGGKWTPSTIRTALRSPRNAGLVAHRGEVVAEASHGQRIVPVDLWQRVHAILDDPERRTSPGRPANTIMSGIARCGRCGGPMNASMKTDRPGRPKRPVYICAREQHLSRNRHLIDEPVLDLVRNWLVEQRDALAPWAQPSAGPAQMKAAAEVTDLTNRLGALAELAAAGELSPDDFAAAARSIRARLADAKRRAVVSAGKPAVANLLAAADPVAAYDELVGGDVEGLRAVLREVLDEVVVMPGKTGDEGLQVRWAATGASAPAPAADA